METFGRLLNVAENAMAGFEQATLEITCKRMTSLS
jgi:hypothetical protein